MHPVSNPHKVQSIPAPPATEDGTNNTPRCRWQTLRGQILASTPKSNAATSDESAEHTSSPSHGGQHQQCTSADGRQFVNRAREEAGSYYDTYGHRILPNVLASRLALYAHYFTMGHYRPFGCAALSAGYDADMQVPELYMVEPSGQCLKYYACAAGKGAQAARTELEKVLNSRQERGITCLEAVDELARILHIIRDPSKDKPFELEMGWLTETSGYTYTLVPADAVKAADAKGKASLEGSAVVPVAGASAGGAGMDL